MASTAYNLTFILTYLESLSPKELNAALRDAGFDTIESLHTALSHPIEDLLRAIPEYRAMKAIMLYVSPVLVIVGTLGNAMALMVFRHRSMKQTPAYTYLAVLSISDTLVLYVGLLRLWVGELLGFDVRDKAEWICKLVNFSGSVASDFSAWMILAVTAVRYLVVYHPIRSKAMCGAFTTRNIISFLLMTAVLANSHLFWTLAITEETEDGRVILRCDGHSEYVYFISTVWPWIDAILYCLGPFMSVLTLNILIIRQVSAKTAKRTMLQSGIVHRAFNARKTDWARKRVTSTLLVVSFTFLITTLPMSFSIIAAHFVNSRVSSIEYMTKFMLVHAITQLFMYLNHSINFFLYCAAGEKFRYHIVHFFCKVKRRRLSTSDNAQYFESINPKQKPFRGKQKFDETKL